MAERKQFPLRINPHLWEELNRWAAEELRSVNAQIEFILQRAVNERRRHQPRHEAGEGGASSTAPPSPGDLG